MKWKIWYNLPNNKSFCFVSRSGSSSIGLTALKQFHPERIPDFPIVDGQGHRLHDYMVGEHLPPECAVMVRNPVDRFCSLINKFNMSPDQALAIIHWYFGLGEKPSYTDRHHIEYIYGTTIYHFMPVSSLIENDSKLFLWPNFDGMLNFLGINQRLCHINQSTHSNISLSSKQKDFVKQAYQKDMEIWNNLIKY